MTHNTKEICRRNKDSNPVATAALKPSDAKEPFKKGGKKQMAYLTAIVESLMKKGLKKAMKSKKRKLDRAYDLSSSSNSNLEQEIGCRDMEHIVDKRLKLDEPFFSDLQSTQPCLFKFSNPVPISTRADKKALN